MFFRHSASRLRARRQVGNHINDTTARFPIGEIGESEDRRFPGGTPIRTNTTSTTTITRGRAPSARRAVKMFPTLFPPRSRRAAPRCPAVFHDKRGQLATNRIASRRISPPISSLSRLARWRGRARRLRSRLEFIHGTLNRANQTAAGCGGEDPSL